MCALASLVLATLLLSSPAARAGSWLFTCTGNGSNLLTYGYPGMSPVSTAWTPPGPQTGTFSLGGSFGGGSDYATSDAATISVTVTATWTHATGQDNTSDPAPPSVWLCESAEANWSDGSGGSANDGLGESKAAATSSGRAASSDAPASTPPAHWTKCAVSSGVATLPQRTLTAEGDFPTTTSRPYGDFCTAHIASYNVTVHATPYNFRSSGYTALDGSHVNKVVQDNANAILALSYVWDSTDGDRTHLGSCTIAENLTWDSNLPGVGNLGANPNGDKYYAPPSPPVGVNAQGQPLAYPDPTITKKPATDPGITDTFTPDEAYMQNYKNVSWWGDQVYVFSDTATGEMVTPLPGPAAGTFRVTRTVARLGLSNDYGLTISTRGYPAGPMTLPR